jgi:hypothetical protein
VPADPEARLYTPFYRLGSLHELAIRLRRAARAAAHGPPPPAAANAAVVAPDDLDEAAATLQTPQQPPLLPEAFVWHAYESLAFAVRNISNGMPYDTEGRAPGWQSVIHRYITPANIFLHDPALDNTQAPQEPPRPYVRNLNLQPGLCLGNFAQPIYDNDPELPRQAEQRFGDDQWQSGVRRDCHGRGDAYAVGAIVAYLCNDGMRNGDPHLLSHAANNQYSNELKDINRFATTGDGSTQRQFLRELVRRRPFIQSRPRNPLQQGLLVLDVELIQLDRSEAAPPLIMASKTSKA